MKYAVEIIERFKNAHGLPLAYADYGTNTALFKGGIALNEILQTPRESHDYNVDLYPSREIEFANLVLSHPDIPDMVFSVSESDFAPPVIIRLSRRKQTTITVIDSGNENEIIENFGINSWSIEFKGILVDMENHQYPGSKVKQLVSLFNINDIIDVSCPLLLDAGIQSVWLEDQIIEPVEGFPDSVKFSFRARSIKPATYSLII